MSTLTAEDRERWHQLVTSAKRAVVLRITSDELLNGPIENVLCVLAIDAVERCGLALDGVQIEINDAAHRLRRGIAYQP